MKREANHQTTFMHWLTNVYRKTGAYELKQTQTDSLPFSAVMQHQNDALWHTRNKFFAFKIPDAGFQNPYDCYSMFQEPAYVVIFYPEFFCLIPINTFLLEKEKSKRKSLLSSRAKEIATLVVLLSSK